MQQTVGAASEPRPLTSALRKQTPVCANAKGSEAGDAGIFQEHLEGKHKSPRGQDTAAGAVVTVSQGPEYRLPRPGKDRGFYSQCDGKPLDSFEQA